MERQPIKARKQTTYQHCLFPHTKTTIMKNLALYPFAVAILFATVFSACKTNTPKPVAPKLKAGLVLGNPINYYDDSTLLFPVGCDYTPSNDNLAVRDTSPGRIFSTAGTFTVYDCTQSSANGYTAEVKEYRNLSPDNFDMRNLLFMNKFTRHSYPLADSALHILSFEIHKEFVRPYVFYKVVKQDLNGDSLFTSRDITTLYYSRPDGSHFTQLTPDGEDYSTYFYYPETHSLLFKTYRDSNNDKAIAYGDESNFYEIDLRNPGMGKNIFPDSLRDELKTFIAL